MDIEREEFIEIDDMGYTEEWSDWADDDEAVDWVDENLGTDVAKDAVPAGEGKGDREGKGGKEPDNDAKPPKTEAEMPKDDGQHKEYGEKEEDVDHGESEDPLEELNEFEAEGDGSGSPDDWELEIADGRVVKSGHRVWMRDNGSTNIIYRGFARPDMGGDNDGNGHYDLALEGEGGGAHYNAKSCLGFFANELGDERHEYPVTIVDEEWSVKIPELDLALVSGMEIKIYTFASKYHGIVRPDEREEYDFCLEGAFGEARYDGNPCLGFRADYDNHSWVLYTPEYDELEDKHTLYALEFIFPDQDGGSDMPQPMTEKQQKQFDAMFEQYSQNTPDLVQTITGEVIEEMFNSGKMPGDFYDEEVQQSVTLDAGGVRYRFTMSAGRIEDTDGDINEVENEKEA